MSNFNSQRWKQNPPPQQIPQPLLYSTFPTYTPYNYQQPYPYQQNPIQMPLAQPNVAPNSMPPEFRVAPIAVARDGPSSYPPPSYLAQATLAPPIIFPSQAATQKGRSIPGSPAPPKHIKTNSVGSISLDDGHRTHLSPSLSPAPPFNVLASPISVASSVSPYLDGTLLDSFGTSGDGLDLFAALDTMGNSDAEHSRDQLQVGLKMKPGIGTSPMMGAEMFEGNEGVLEGLFEDLALLAPDNNQPAGFGETKESGSSLVGNMRQIEGRNQQSIPNLVVSAPDATPTGTANAHNPSMPGASSSAHPQSSSSSTGTTSMHKTDQNSSAESSDDHEPGDEATANGGLFTCACGKGFKKLSSLRSHAKLHGRERNFICDKCHKGFLRKHDLTRHATTHLTGAKPFRCPCGVTFTRQDAMMRHIRAGRCTRPGRGRRRGAAANLTRSQQGGLIPVVGNYSGGFTQYLPAGEGVVPMLVEGGFGPMTAGNVGRGAM